MGRAAGLVSVLAIETANLIQAVAAGLGLPPGGILFLSDVAEELDAAAASGLRTCQLVRAEDGTQPADRHPQAADFPAAARLHGLPVPG